MNWLPTIAVLLCALLVIFLQSGFDLLRNLLGVQPDLLPGLMLYTSLRTNFLTLILLAVVAGLGLDSLSANPLGVSVLPLLVTGLFFHRQREFIVRDQPFAQVLLGLAASAAVPVLTILMLFTLGTHPLVGWGSLWQLAMMTLIGGLAAPAWFALFGWVQQSMVYSRYSDSSFRPDREIRRGRS